MESYEDILETVRGVAAEHDPMFSQKGADAVGMTDRIQRRILDYRNSNAFEGMSPAQRDAIHTKNIEVNGRLLEDARRYELAETFKWAKSECERRTGRNLGELASAFGRRIDLVGSENRDKDGNIIRRIASLTDENGKTVEVDKTREFLEAQIEPIVDEFAAESKNAFKAAYDAYKGLGVGDADAEAAAMKSCHDYVVGSLQGYAECGDEIRGMFVDSVLGKFGNADARLVGPYGKRNDGKTYKGSGWLGEIPVKGGGVATEYTVGVQIDGKEIDIPTLVPTLTKDEVSQMVNDIIPNSKPVPDAIMEKAAAHAKKRLSEGKSVFANDGEAVFDPAGGLWMDDNDVAKIAAYRQRAFADAQRAAASRRASAEDGMRAEIAACGARGDALLSRPDYNFDAVKLGEELNKLDGFVDFAARNGMREVAESAATNARRLRDKAQTMSEKHDAITKKALADAKQVEVTKKFSMYSDACAQFDNDKKEAIVLRALDAGGAADMTGDNASESNITADIVGMSFYMRELSRNVLNLDGLTDDQRRKARDYFERASQESFNTVVSNTQNLLRDIGFHIDADAQTRQILYRGAYQELDDAPSGQGSSRIFLTDAGKAVLGANTVVSWEDPERKIESSRHFGITFTDDKTPRMDGFMKPEMTSIVGSLVDMVNSLGYDLYDGKHEDQKKAIKESLLKTIRTMHGQKNMADLVDAMHESAVRQSIRGSMLPVWDAAEIRKNIK